MVAGTTIPTSVTFCSAVFAGINAPTSNTQTGSTKAEVQNFMANLYKLAFQKWYDYNAVTDESN
jgi:hypothetical protein